VTHGNHYGYRSGVKTVRNKLTRPAVFEGGTRGEPPTTCYTTSTTFKIPDKNQSPGGRFHFSTAGLRSEEDPLVFFWFWDWMPTSSSSQNNNNKKRNRSSSDEMWNSSSSRSKKRGSGTNTNHRNVSMSLDESAILAIFNEMADEDDPSIAGMEGISTLCEKLGIDPLEDIRILVFLWKLGSKEKPGEISKAEWLSGCQSLQVDSIDKIKDLLPSLELGFMDQIDFKEFYKVNVNWDGRMSSLCVVWSSSSSSSLCGSGCC